MLLLTLTAAYRSAPPVAPADSPVVSFADASLSDSSVRYLAIVYATLYMKSVRYCAFAVGGASCSPVLRMGGSSAVCVFVLCTCVRMRGVTNRVIEN